MGLFILRPADRVSSFLSLIVMGYLCIVLGSGYKNVHYLAPITLFPLIISLRRTVKGSNQKLVVIASLCSLSIICLIIAVFPKNYRIHTDYRKYGQETCCLFDSYEDARKNIDNLLTQERWGEDVSLWLCYADVTKHPEKEYDFYFSSENIPPKVGMRLYASDGKCYFWTNKDVNSIIEKTPTRKDFFRDLFKELIIQYP